MPVRSHRRTHSADASGRPSRPAGPPGPSALNPAVSGVRERRAAAAAVAAATAAEAARPWFARKRVWFVLIVLTAALVNPLNPLSWGGAADDRRGRLWDPRDLSDLTPEQLNNLTLKQNAFFADQLLFNNATLLSSLTALFAPVYFPPGTRVLRRGVVPDFLIIQNGSCHVERLSPDENQRFVDNFHAGDSLGGMNLMYGRPSKHDVVASASAGVHAWRAGRKAFRRFLDQDVLLAGAFERKFLRSLVEKQTKRPLIFFPGFASTQLIAWKPKKCVGLSIDVGERVWLDVAKVLHHNVVAERCFVNCMVLDMTEQTDPPDCKLRPEEGVNAIYDLTTGIFAPFTTIFRPLVLNMARKFGYDITSLIAVPYDWRLAPPLLQERDHLFTRIKQQIEQAVRLNRNPGVSICHSMGCNVLHYFIEFMKVTYPDTWKQWMDAHLWMHLSVGAPFLGAIQGVKGFMSGIGFGLPMDIVDVRLMGKTWSSGYWLLPYNVTAPPPPPGIEPFSQWPDKIATIIVDEDQPTRNVSFGIGDVISGTMFTETAKWLGDEDFVKFRQSMHRYYHNDTVFNPIPLNSTGPPRLPIRKIVAVYGVNVPTEIGYRFRIGQAHGKNHMLMREEIYETAGGHHMTKNPLLLGNMRPVPGTQPIYTSSGDGVVPYASLSWVNSWHYANLTIMRVPATSRVDLDVMLTKLGEATKLKDQVIGIKRNLDQSNWMQMINVVEPAFTKYSSVLADPDSDDPFEVTVLEVESVGHRDVIRDSFVLKQIEEELYHQARASFLRTHPYKLPRDAPPQPPTAPDAEQALGPIANIDALLRTFSSRAEETISRVWGLLRGGDEPSDGAPVIASVSDASLLLLRDQVGSADAAPRPEPAPGRS